MKSYWRIAGMSYLKYSSMCAEVVRGCLKEPFLTKVSRRFPRCAPGTRAVRADYSLARHARCSTRADLVSPVSPAFAAKPREAVYFKATPWSGGKPGKSGE